MEEIMNDRKGDTGKFELDQLLHPAQAFQHPAQVVDDPDLTLNEKRAILASWASDACAVEASPELRNAKNGFVRFDEIMDALKQLDGQAASRPHYHKHVNRARRWKDLYRKSGGGTSIFG
jgi:hypothetical protein